MLYAFLGSTLLGALSTAFLLWRKSVVEKDLAVSEARRKAAEDRANRALSELALQQKAFDEQLGRQRDQIETLRKQRDTAIDELAKGAVPGSAGNILSMRYPKKL